MAVELKPGQKVRVMSDLDSNPKYDNSSPGVNSEMGRFAGKTVTIKEKLSINGREWYSIKECRYTWDISFFEPIPVTQDDAFEALVQGSINDDEYQRIISELK